MSRLQEIHANFIACLQEAEGWLGEVAAIETMLTTSRRN